MVFLPRFRFYFQFSEANNSYSSYIYFDLTIFCVDGIFLLLTGFQWRVQTHARVFFAVQLNWYVIVWFGVMFSSQNHEHCQEHQKGKNFSTIFRSSTIFIFFSLSYLSFRWMYCSQIYFSLYMFCSQIHNHQEH